MLVLFAEYDDDSVVVMDMLMVPVLSKVKLFIEVDLLELSSFVTV